MSAMQRSKGQRGEREVANIIADITGFEVSRRCRQHDGDSDLVGVPGWSIEVKRHAAASRASIQRWWEQSVQQARKDNDIPVLAFKADRQPWRMVWPVAATLGLQTAEMWMGYEWTVEGSPECWAAVVRDVVAFGAARAE